MAVGVVPIDAVNDRVALVIGFKQESFATVPMRLHLLREEGLKFDNPGFHRRNHLGTIRAVIGQEVEEAHGARFADVQILQPLGRRGEGALPLLGIEGLEMRAIGWRRRLMGEGRRCEKRTEHGR